MSRKLLAGLPSFPVPYTEGLKVGYKWYDAEHKPVLYPFGFGLSYTTFAYSALAVSPGKLQGSSAHLTFTVTNTGVRTGAEISQVYTTMPSTSGEPPKRLVGWVKVTLAPGEVKQVSLDLPTERFQMWDEAHHHWTVIPGSYTLFAGPNSQELPLRQSLTLP